MYSVHHLHTRTYLHTRTHLHTHMVYELCKLSLLRIICKHHGTQGRLSQATKVKYLQQCFSHTRCFNSTSCRVLRSSGVWFQIFPTRLPAQFHAVFQDRKGPCRLKTSYGIYVTQPTALMLKTHFSQVVPRQSFYKVLQPLTSI